MLAHSTKFQLVLYHTVYSEEKQIKIKSQHYNRLRGKKVIGQEMTDFKQTCFLGLTDGHTNACDWQRSDRSR